MLLEIVLYVKQRMSGRVMVGDGEIVAVIENGLRRTPKSKSFNEAVRHIMDKTDLEPHGQPQQIGAKSYFTTYRYTYRKPGVYVQKEYDRWACAHPVEDHWMVKKAGKDVETRYESKAQAMVAVDAWVGYDFVGDVRRKMVDKNHQTRREKDE